MFEKIIGLEVHIQIKTKSKMFCRCDASYFGALPNTKVCPVCFGLPGALPVPNKLAFEKALKTALALECKINQYTKFDRKNYFYPDLPKGYQISQYDKPIGENGFVEIELNGDSRRIRIKRVHLEEDTAKSLHGENEDTLIDFNKSGIPLLEIVTEPDFTSVLEVSLFAKRLRQIVRFLDVSDADMQKGQMRFELNISTRREGDINLPKFKVEVKNIGSISVLEKVINKEFERQSDLLQKGQEIKSQTRGLKDMSGKTLFQRYKETEDDYRYFTEPDIPPIKLTKKEIEEIYKQIPELPHQKKLRYISIGLEGEQADIFLEDFSRDKYFENCLKLLEENNSSNKTKEVAKWILGDISGLMEKNNKKFIPISPSSFVYLIDLLFNKQISGTVLKKILEKVFEDPNIDPKEFINKENLLQKTSGEDLKKIINEVINENPKVVSDYSKNQNAIKYLIGCVMRKSKGQVNPKLAEEELKKFFSKI